jgi:hypothetical protein
MGFRLSAAARLFPVAGREVSLTLSDAEMAAQLDALPPGHPSSPWNQDGSRKPPPPRLRDMELPLPGAWRDCPDDEALPPGQPRPEKFAEIRGSGEPARPDGTS